MMQSNSIIDLKAQAVKAKDLDSTICPRSSDPFYVVSCYIKWATTSWTHSSRHFYKKKIGVPMLYPITVFFTNRA